MGFEENLQKAVFNPNREKTFIDKLLAKEDVNAMREIVKKPNLTRHDLLELLYLISSAESKLYNFSVWDRYIILKFFVWIREFVKVAEILWDEKEKLEKRETICKNCKKTLREDCECTDPQPNMIITPRTRVLFDNNARLIEHNIKFLVDLYLNIARTSLSIGATGFRELLVNKFEMSYPQQQLATNIPQQTTGVLKQRGTF